MMLDFFWKPTFSGICDKNFICELFSLKIFH